MERDDDAVRLAAPAKLNLFLAVLAREDDGWHQLDTLFCRLELADRIEVRRAGPGIRLEVRGAELGPPRDNLVHRAARAFHHAAGLPPGVGIALEKRIPVGAGLGGGSSDAAATLRALNALHGEPLDEGTLLRLGAGLGADVPFFLTPTPLALAWGRGERLLSLSPLPTAPVLLAVPPFASPTGDAYRALDAARTAGAPRPLRLEPGHLAAWEGVARLAFNDFEEPLFARHPLLARAREALEEAGARPARLTGSGSALFGVFQDEARRDEAAAALRARFPELRTLPTRTAA